jgi:hypothetical protein
MLRQDDHEERSSFQRWELALNDVRMVGLPAIVGLAPLKMG